MLVFFSFLSFSIDFVIWPFSAHKKHQKKSFMGDHAMRRSKIKDFHLSFRNLVFFTCLLARRSMGEII